MWDIQDWPRWMATADDQALLPIVPGPEDILVMVAGGPGKHSAVIPNCCFSRAVSRVVTRWPLAERPPSLPPVGGEGAGVGEVSNVE